MPIKRHLFTYICMQKKIHTDMIPQIFAEKVIVIYECLKKAGRRNGYVWLSTMLGRMLNYLLVILHTKLFLPEQLAVTGTTLCLCRLSLVVYTFGMESAYFWFARKENDRQQVLQSCSECRHSG